MPVSKTAVLATEERADQLQLVIQQVKEKDDQLQQHKQQLLEKNDQLQLFIQKVQEKDDQLQLVIQQVKEKDDQLQQHKQQLLEKNDQLQLFIQKVQEKDDQLQLVIQQVKEKDDQLQELTVLATEFSRLKAIGRPPLDPDSVTTCMFCCQEERMIIFRPCNHICCGINCLPRFENEPCPVCRGQIESWKFVFL